MDNFILTWMGIVHPGKTAAFINGLEKARRRLQDKQGWGGLPLDTVHGHLIEPVLLGLGYSADRRVLLDEAYQRKLLDHDTGAREMALWLVTDGHRVALLITDSLAVDYTRDEVATATIDARQTVLRDVTGFAGCIVFTNGRNWRIYERIQEDWVPAVDFSLDSPGGFWGLFMLSLPEGDDSYGNE